MDVLIKVAEIANSLLLYLSVIIWMWFVFQFVLTFRSEYQSWEKLFTTAGVSIVLGVCHVLFSFLLEHTIMIALKNILNAVLVQICLWIVIGALNGIGNAIAWKQELVDIRKKEIEKKEQFDTLMAENKVKYNTSISKEDVKKIKKLAKLTFDRKNARHSPDFQLENYLKNYGYINFGEMKLCGLGQEDPELNMIEQTKTLYEKCPETKMYGYVVLKKLGDNRCLIVSGDRVYEYDMEKCKHVSYDSVKLYDCILKRIEKEKNNK